MQHILILFISGVFGGIINAIAGGGGILIYPALLASGVPPINASATVSFAVFPGVVSATIGYRKHLEKIAKHFLWLIIPCMVGAFFGARFLANINPATFAEISPWLVLSAVVLLALQAKIHSLIVDEKRIVNTTQKIAIPLLFLMVFTLAVYGGFFGVGFGLMILVVLGFTSLKNSYELSAVKNLCGVGVSFVAASYFAAHGLIDVTSGVVVAVGTVAGGFGGSKLSQHVSSKMVHNLTVVLGLIVSAVLIAKNI